MGLYLNNIEIEQKWVSDREEWTSIEQYVLFLKQLAAYEYINSYCYDKIVLDYGCGSGYGTMSISEHSRRVVGVDIDAKLIDYCRQKYKRDNLSFILAKPNNSLPFNDNIYDIIVSFQVIEHVKNVSQYLQELKRLLKVNGLLFLTTPNRDYRLLPYEKPWNLEHRREYSLKAFEKQLKGFFERITIFGVNGNEEVCSIERNRIYRSTFKHLMGIILPSSIFSFLIDMRKDNRNRLDSGKQVLPASTLCNYSIDDFHIAECTDRSLDLMAICNK